MKFKYINKAIGIAALSAALTGCALTDVDPANLIPENVALGDAARIQAAVVGAYEAAQRGWYAGAIDRGYPFGAASTEQGDLRGEDMYNDQLFYEVTYTNAWNTTTANNNGMWIALYRLINRCNVVIDGLAPAVTAGILTQEVADRYRGELLFLRALSYHELLIHFCRPISGEPTAYGVPYRVVGIDGASEIDPNLSVDRGTVQATYQALLKDLDDAEQIAPANGAGSVGPFRATKGAVIALKTRVKLHMRDWDGVLTDYEKIRTTYSLTPSPETPFTNWSSSEAVFSLQNSSVSNPGTNAALANMYGSPTFGARGLVKVSPIIWKSAFWLDGDSRRTLLTTSVSSGVYTTKYRKYGVNDDATPLIRFSEVVLNAAEANARKGGANLDAAITLLNIVRDRSKPAAAPSYDLATLVDQNGVLNAIWNERRIEFLAEGRRWSDIHRLSGEGVLAGVPAKATSRSVTALAQYSTGTVTLSHSLPYTSDLFIWPLPLNEVLNNPTLAAQQNKGY